MIEAIIVKDNIIPLESIEHVNWCNMLGLETIKITLNSDETICFTYDSTDEALIDFSGIVSALGSYRRKQNQVTPVIKYQRGKPVGGDL